MLRRASIVLLLALSLAAQLIGQSSRKFLVKGKVVNAVNGHPLPGAQLWIGSADDFDATQQMMRSMDDGGFAFTVSEAGKYFMLGEARGFRRQGFEQHGMYVSAVAVGPGVGSENLIFRLRPDGRILGTVVDDDHEPVPSATVYLFRTDASGGLRQTYLATQTATDDRGMYRVAHLEPGCYYLVVSAAPWFSNFVPTAEPENDVGATGQRALEMIYPTTFYPGVTDQASATPIALNEGEDFTADFTLTSGPALRVRLNHLNSDPQRQRAATLQESVFGLRINTGSQREVPVGDSLEIRNVAPGRYVLDIQSYDASQETRSRVLDLMADTEVDPDRGATVPSIAGTVRMEGDPNVQTRAIVRLWNSRTNEGVEAQVGQKGKMVFDSDWITPGRYSVFAQSGQYSTIAILNAIGARVEGQTIEIAAGRRVQLDIVMAQNLSKIEGVAQKEGKPFPGAMVLLVPENPEVNLPKFRRDESDGDGTFSLLDVLPGRYKVMAVEDGWDWEWGNAALLKKRLERAQEIVVERNRTYRNVVQVE
jgi:hypothetical protein